MKKNLALVVLFVCVLNLFSDLNSGLTAYYPFNGNSNDLSGNGYDGTANGNIQLAQDRFGNVNSSYEFDGIDDYISLPDIQYSTSITISLWLKPNSNWNSTTGRKDIIYKSDNTTQTVEYAINYDDYDGKLGFFIEDGIFITSSINLFQNQWYLIVGTYDHVSGVGKLFCNNSLIGMSNNSNSPMDCDEYFTVGQRPDGNFKIDGCLDDLRLYNRAISESEISELYHSNSWPTLETGLVAYYPFNGNINDESGNSNDCINNGAYLIHDRFGNANSAYYFDGVDDYILSGFEPSGLNSLSACGWIKQENVSELYARIFGVQTSSGRFHAMINPENQKVTTEIRIEGVTSQFNSNDSIAENQWYFLCSIYDNMSLKIYLNGSESGAIDVTGFIDEIGQNVAIGCDYGSSALHFFNGIIDDIRFYNRALTQSEISELYHQNCWDFTTDFAVNETQTMPSTEIQFTDISTGDPTSWQWDFDNDGTIDSYEQNPAWSYSQIGNYSVTLTTSNESCNSSETKIDYISVVEPLDYGLVAYYPFNGNANDESGNGNDGTENGGVQISADRFGNANSAYFFDGINDYIEIPPIEESESTTWSTWIKCTSNSTDQCFISRIDDETIDIQSLFFRATSNTFEADWMIDQTWFQPSSAATIDAWKFLVVTYNKNSQELLFWIDGVIVDSVSLYSIGSGFDSIFVGRNGDTPNEFVNGYIDDIRFYNRALSRLEILELYHQNCWDFTSDFAVNETQAIPDTEIQFTDTSTGNPTSWQWDFDNNGTIDSYDQNPTWSYSQFGNYTVTLTSSNESCNSSETKIDFISVVEPLDYGLVAYYPFNGNANDESGNGNDGTNNGATSFQDRFGSENSAYDFNGLSNFIDVDFTSNLVINNQLTVCSWVNAESFSNDYNTIISKSSTTSGPFQFEFMQNGGLLSAVYYNPGSIQYQNNFQTDEWLFVCTSFDGNYAKIYVDGLMVAVSEELNNVLTNDNQHLNIGRESWNSSRYFNGKIDDIRIYTRALSDSEISELYFNANFTSSTIPAYLGEEIQYTDISTGNPTSWEWDFDNDGTIDSYDQNPVWTYLQAGDYDVTLTISNNDFTNTITKTNFISISINPNPVLHIEQSILDFGDVRINTSSTKQIEVSNFGQELLTVFIPDATCFDVSLPSKNELLVINSLETQAVSIEFTPNVLGEINDALSLLSNDPVNNPYNFIVTGNGVQPEIASIHETGIDCGSVYLTDTSENFLIEIENTGSMDLIIDTVSFTEGTNVFNYSYQNFALPISPGEKDSIYVDFSPIIIGTFIDSILFNNSSENSPNFKIELTGEGIFAPPSEPENLYIEMNGVDANLSWDPVTTNIYGAPIAIDYYIIYSSITSPDKGFSFSGYVPSNSTNFTNSGIAIFYDKSFYKVKAYTTIPRNVLSYFDEVIEKEKNVSKEKIEKIIVESVIGFK